MSPVPSVPCPQPRGWSYPPTAGSSGPAGGAVRGRHGRRRLLGLRRHRARARGRARAADGGGGAAAPHRAGGGGVFLAAVAARGLAALVRVGAAQRAGGRGAAAARGRRGRAAAGALQVRLLQSAQVRARPGPGELCRWLGCPRAWGNQSRCWGSVSRGAPRGLLRVKAREGAKPSPLAGPWLSLPLSRGLGLTFSLWRGRKAHEGLATLSEDGQSPISLRQIAYVSGLSFGITSGVFSIVNILVDSAGPGTVGIHGDSPYYFITSAFLTMALVLLHTFWGVIFFDACEQRRAGSLGLVVGSHLLTSGLTFLNPWYEASLGPIFILTLCTGLWAFSTAGGSFRNVLKCLSCKQEPAGRVLLCSALQVPPEE